jgi:hypothetical protein
VARLEHHTEPKPRPPPAKPRHIANNTHMPADQKQPKPEDARGGPATDAGKGLRRTPRKACAGRRGRPAPDAEEGLRHRTPFQPTPTQPRNKPEDPHNNNRIPACRYHERNPIATEPVDHLCGAPLQHGQTKTEKPPTQANANPKTSHPPSRGRQRHRQLPHRKRRPPHHAKEQARLRPRREGRDRRHLLQLVRRRRTKQQRQDQTQKHQAAPKRDSQETQKRPRNTGTP